MALKKLIMWKIKYSIFLFVTINLFLTFFLVAIWLAQKFNIYSFFPNEIQFLQFYKFANSIVLFSILFTICIVIPIQKFLNKWDI